MSDEGIGMGNRYQQLFRALEWAAHFTGLAPGRLDAHSLVVAALRRSDRQAFSDPSFVNPLTRLLRACDEESDLSLFGRLAVRFDVLRCLNNLLQFDAAEEASPQIAERAISRPIFITGLPRSGSTFLHTLLSLDPANAVPRAWELIYPYPDRRRLLRADRRRRRVEHQFRVFRSLAPGIEGMHPLSADAPQECTDITAQVFQSLRFDTTYRIPSYQRWIDEHGHDASYRFHRRFLQHLDCQSPGRQWVLKSPDHVFALDALRAVYPDARIVMLHRDPLSVLASVAKLTELLRRPFARHVDCSEIGREVSNRWVDGARRMVAADRSENRILHLHYREVVKTPLATVAAVYRHCGMTLSAEAERRVLAYLRQTPHGGYDVHRHNLGEFGLDAARLRERFAAYMRYYDVEQRQDKIAPPYRRKMNAA
ncbi:MAG: sulfotransferase [Alphaproteobacteria bacterium]|nr:sulfotransferase [Alphaproteobacteria bacterium]MBU6473266.1 sulfotransferase [Alphaproteobacteria bacterium]